MGCRWLPLVFLMGCAPPPPGPPPRPGTTPVVESTPTPKAEFKQALQRLEASDQWCFGRVQLHRLERELKQPELLDEDRCQILSELSYHQLRLGQTQQALRSLEQALALARPHQKSDLLAQRAVIWMRQGEVRNCIDQHNASSCIYPVQPHGEAGPARRALTDLLASHPEKYPQRRWLLNLVAMQVGRYPQVVPAALRVKRTGQADPALAFQDVATSSGVHDRDLCGGVVFDDLNGDGLLDLVASSADYHESVRLYKNLGGGQFELQKDNGLQDQVGAFNVRAGDYDNDGDLDLLLVRGAFLREEGCVRRSLMQNQGDGTFLDVTYAAGLARPAQPSGTAAWGDFDGDGWLDFFQANETMDPTLPHPCQLFHNNGDGTFREIGRAAGVDLCVYAKGVAVGDIDNDGHLDLYVSDFNSQKASNHLLRNRGDGTFQDVTLAWGAPGPPYRGFASWFFDYDNDGFLDLFVGCYQAAKLEPELGPYLQRRSPQGLTCLYHNEGGRRFRNVSQAAGVAGPYSVMGSSFGDMDGDGFLDLHLGTGAPFYDYLIPNKLLRNRRGRGFEDVTEQRGVGHLQKGHGCAFADYDNDGDQDLFVNLGGTFPADGFQDALFRNPARGRHFLHVRLLGPKSTAGARLRLDCGKQSQHRAVGCMSSFGYTPWRQEFALPRRADNLHVRWPSGRVQDFPRPPLDALVGLEEGRADLILYKLPAGQGPESFCSEPSGQTTSKSPASSSPPNPK